MKTIINKFHNTSIRSNLLGYDSLETIEYAASYDKNIREKAMLTRIKKALCPHKCNQCACIITEIIK